jgi:hypothetical protein
MTLISMTFISIAIAALGLICLWFANESETHWGLFFVLKIFGGALVVGAIFVSAIL